MRISDWSSDVCSSDLQRFGEAAHGDGNLGVDRPESPATRGDHLAIQPLCRLELAQVIEQHRQVVPARRHVGVVVAQLRAARGDGLPVPRLAFLQQIGRASVRERECQYVEISVGAGSLKKKKKKKI